MCADGESAWASTSFPCRRCRIPCARTHRRTSTASTPTARCADCRTADGVDPERLAARFAAKEATLKVLRPRDGGVPWSAIEVRRDPGGWVEIELTGGRRRARRGGGRGRPRVSLTHEGGFAAAVVIAELRRQQPIRRNVTDEIRQILSEHGRLAVDVGEPAGRRRPLPGRDDLARERQRDARARGRLRHRVPRPHAQAQRVRERRRDRAALDASSQTHGGAASSVAADRDQAFLDGVRRIADEVAAPNADDVDRNARFPVETIDALRDAAARCRPSSRRARRRRRLVRGGRRAPASSSAAAAARARWSSPCTRSRWRRIVRHLETRRWFEALPARGRRRAAPDRLGHLRGRHRRRHGPLDRRASTPGDDGAVHVREAGADRQLRRATPTTCSPPCAARRTPSPATRCSC